MLTTDQCRVITLSGKQCENLPEEYKDFCIYHLSKKDKVVNLNIPASQEGSDDVKKVPITNSVIKKPLPFGMVENFSIPNLENTVRIGTSGGNFMMALSTLINLEEMKKKDARSRREWVTAFVDIVSLQLSKDLWLDLISNEKNITTPILQMFRDRMNENLGNVQIDFGDVIDSFQETSMKEFRRKMTESFPEGSRVFEDILDTVFQQYQEFFRTGEFGDREIQMTADVLGLNFIILGENPKNKVIDETYEQAIMLKIGDAVYEPIVQLKDGKISI